MDYEDFLRQRGLIQWTKTDPRRQALVDLRPKNADAVARWVLDEHRKLEVGLSGQQAKSILSTPSTKSTSSTPPFEELAANAALILINVATSLLDRQILSLAKSFEKEGGFTERLYRVRTQNRKNPG